MSLILSGTSGLSDVDGSAATPAIRGANASTGIFFPAADTIGFAEGGVEAMRLDSSGNLGVGTTSPASDARLTLASPTTESYVMFSRTNSPFFDVAVGNNGGSIVFKGGANSATVAGLTEFMRLDSVGNLGIGVTPSAWSGGKAIQVKNSSNPIFISETAGDGWFGYNSYYNGTNWIYVGSYYANALKMADGQFQFMQAASGTAGNAITFTQAMTLTAAGNLGVGTTSPVGKLESKTATIAPASANYAQKAFVANLPYSTSNVIGSMLSGWDGSSIHGVDVGMNYNGTGYDMIFSTNDNTSGDPIERARIDSSGNLLVGRTAQTANERFNATTTTSTVWSMALNSVDRGWLNRQSNSSGGLAAYFEVGASNTAVGNITTTASATAYNTSSDYRLKNTIAPMTGALAKVALLKPCTYKWNIDGSDGQGFIAHELAEVVPQCVTGAKDAVDAESNPQYQGIDTSFLVATLTAAMQEQQALITQLQADVAALKGAA